ncbi:MULTISPECIES: hypothetical protein [unclassified Pseudomonas]|uniref:hypothetical protein n=1 Tax=unclassified Pseudomonas TaxID=196821 RepID=UPI0005386E2F|nr:MULTISPECIES: hypothetical protein [unclassified Pseudomonas]MBD0686731.1 hypothetical protein [Pseudomonas sp. PSB18]CDF92950.1 hypothetical protein BN844_2695 [Pseudomonas sp. SHC52]
MSDSSTTADQTILVLSPPRLPRATTPVTGAHYGVPKHVYDLEPMGCAVEVDPYQGQQGGDTVSINLNGELALDSDQTQGVDDMVTLYIPHAKLLVGIVNRLTYTVTRGSNNLGSSEPPLEILYNSIRPGIEDATPGDNAHSELVLLLPDEIKNGVGPGFTRATVCVAYPYCRAYDRIRLNCNGHDVYHTVSVSEAPAPPAHGSSTPTTVCFDVTSADLSDDPEFKFSFTVNDQLNNSPDPDAPWSAVQVVDVDQAGTRLPQPIPREIASDAGDDPSTIDLDKLGANPLLLIVLTGDSRFMPGDTVEATYVAKVAGQPDVVASATGTVETDGLGQKQACVLMIPNDKVIAGSTVQASYRLLRNTALVGTSKTARATVIGEGGLDLRPPSVKEANGNSLDPVDAKDALTVVVRQYDGMLGSDGLSVTWAGTAGAGSYTTPTEDVGVVGDKEVPIPVEVLAFNLGKQVTVTYTVVRNKRASATPSEPLLLNVRDIAQGDLPTPLILEAANAGAGPELDLASFAGDANLKVAPWPLMALDQKVWLRCEGIKSDGTKHTITLQAATGVTTEEVRTGLSKPVPRGQLQLLRDRSDLTLMLEVTFDKSPEVVKAIAFPLRTYSIKSVVLETPLITSVKDSSDAPISDGGYTLATSIKLTGEATPNTKVEIFDNDEYKSTLEVGGNGLWNGTLSGLVTGGHSLTARAIYRSNPVSPPWRLTVVQAMTIDTSHAVLSTRIYRTAKFPVRPPVGAYVERIPSGGVPPYIYTSSDPDVAEIFSSEHPRVVSRFSGAATITIRDQIGGSVAYPVTTSGVWMLMGMGDVYKWHTYWNCWGAAVNNGGVIPDLQTWGAIRTTHDGDPGLGSVRSWTSNSAPGDRREYSINPLTGETDSLSQDHDYATGWLIKAI